jgi:hypothetical protein
VSFSLYDLFPPHRDRLDEKWGCIVGASSNADDSPTGKLRSSSLYSILLKVGAGKGILHPTGEIRFGETIVLYKVDEAIFPDPDSSRCSDTDSDVMVDFLRLCGKKVVTPQDKNGRYLKHIYEELVAAATRTAVTIRTVTPALVLKVVKAHPEILEQLHEESLTATAATGAAVSPILVILRYVLHGALSGQTQAGSVLRKQLDGARLIPLMDGSLGTMSLNARTNKGGSSPLLFIASNDSERHLYSAIKDKVVDDRSMGAFDSSLLEKVKTNLCSNDGVEDSLNLCLVTVELTSQLLHLFEPLLLREDACATLPTSAGSPETSVLIGLNLGKAFWNFLRDQAQFFGSEKRGQTKNQKMLKDPAVSAARLFFGFPLLFDSTGRAHPLCSKDEHCLLQGEGFPSDAVVRVVKQLGGALLNSDILPLIPPTVRTMCIHEASAEGVLEVCSQHGRPGGQEERGAAGGLESHGRNSCSSLDDKLEQTEDKETLVRYFSHEAHRLQDTSSHNSSINLIDTLKSLPIFQLVESTPDSPVYISIAQGDFITFPCSEDIHPLLCPPGKVLKPFENREALLAMLGVKFEGKAKILTEYGLDHLSSVGLSPAVRNTCMIGILREYPVLAGADCNFLPKLKKTTFIPKTTLLPGADGAAGGGETSLVSLSPIRERQDTWLFDPEEAEVRALFKFEQSPYFPAAPFNTQEVLSILRGLGLRSHLSGEHVVDRAISVQLFAEQEAEQENRAAAAGNFHESSQLFQPGFIIYAGWARGGICRRGIGEENGNK